MARRWLVDANNVVGSRPDGWWRDRPGALARLVDEVDRWRAETGETVVLVADGKPTDVLPGGEVGGVEVVYAGSTARDAADDVIVGLVASAAEPSDVVVVTSDRELAGRVSALGAEVEGAGRFLRRMAEV